MGAPLKWSPHTLQNEMKFRYPYECTCEYKITWDLIWNVRNWYWMLSPASLRKNVPLLLLIFLLPLLLLLITVFKSKLFNRTHTGNMRSCGRLFHISLFCFEWLHADKFIKNVSMSSPNRKCFRWPDAWKLNRPINLAALICQFLRDTLSLHTFPPHPQFFVVSHSIRIDFCKPIKFPVAIRIWESFGGERGWWSISYFWTKLWNKSKKYLCFIEASNRNQIHCTKSFSSSKKYRVLQI